MPPEPNVGSGKFVSPCSRMHRENWSIAAFRAADRGGGCPPFGSCERQLLIADWNAGPLTLTPLTLSEGPEPARCEAWIWIPPLPLPAGSGKLGTPCDRMQFANLTIRSGLAALVAGSWDEPHAASPAAAVMARRGVILRMRVVYETGDNTAGTTAVTSA